MDVLRRGESLDKQSDEAVGSSIVRDVNCGTRDGFSKDRRFLGPRDKATIMAGWQRCKGFTFSKQVSFHI